MENKFFGRTCPKCASLCTEYQIAKVAIGPGVQANLICENGHRWSEFYHLIYTGYWWDGKKYDTYGEEIKKET